MSQRGFEDLSDVFGLGHPIRPFRLSMRKTNGSGYATISRTEIAPENVFAIWDQCFVMYPCSGDQLLRKERAKQLVLRVCEFCKDRSRLFIGESIIRSSVKQVALEGGGSEERIILLKQFLVRAFGYDHLPSEARYYREANPEILLDNRSLGMLGEIISEFQH